MSQTEVNKIPTIFISYSRKDEKWCEAILDYFAPLVRQKKLHIWYDKMVSSGGRFEEQILEALEESDAVIFLVSTAFFASEFIWNKEIPMTMEKWKKGEVKIFPVLVNNCLWRYTEFANIQFSHDVAEPLLYLDDKRQNHEITKIVGDVIKKLLGNGN